MKPTLWSRVPQPYRYAMILGGSCIASATGIILGVHYKSPGIASRAGAVSAIMGLALILVRPDYGRMSYEVRFPSEGVKHTISPTTHAEVEALTQWLFLNSDGQDHQNKAVVLAGFIGSLFWGFGDKIVEYLIR